MEDAVGSIRVGRDVARALLVFALVWPMSASFAGPVSASSDSCIDTWTGDQYSTKSVVVGTLETYASSLHYKLMFNTCNLGVYTKINVTQFTNTYTITGACCGFTYRSENGEVLRDCKGHSASGCVTDPGLYAYFDARDFSRTGNGLIVRNASPPNLIFTYNVHAAIWDFETTADGVPYWRFVYQFLTDQIATG
jgi:hypothetical protein